jgi:STE24 endopeptidase
MIDCRRVGRLDERSWLTFVWGLVLGLSVVGAWLAAPPLAAQARPHGNHPTASGGAQPRPGAAPAYTLGVDQLAKAVALSRIRNLLAIAGSVWGIVFLWLLLALKGWSALEAWAGRRSGRRSVEGLLFFAAFLVITWLAGLPLDLYGHHAELSYGVSVEGWARWFTDQAKALGLTVVIGAPLLVLFHAIVRRWPRRYWLGAWLVTIPLLVLLFFIEPLFEPIFYKFEPLSEHYPALVNQLERVVARTGTEIPPSRIFLMRASEKTNGLNAYVTGIGSTKRIVVWDTTAGRIPDDEILFIFGHESGHYVLHHVAKGLLIAVIGLFFIYRVCAGLAGWFIRRFGPRWRAPDLGSRTGFVILILSISIIGFLVEPAMNAISRHFEHQADVYGQEAIHGIVPDPGKTAVAAFNDLGRAWLDDPDPNPLIEFWLYSHPSLASRAQFALGYDPWANGGHGRYFSR